MVSISCKMPWPAAWTRQTYDKELNLLYSTFLSTNLSCNLLPSSLLHDVLTHLLSEITSDYFFHHYAYSYVFSFHRMRKKSTLESKCPYHFHLLILQLKKKTFKALTSPCEFYAKAFGGRVTEWLQVLLLLFEVFLVAQDTSISQLWVLLVVMPCLGLSFLQESHKQQESKVPCWQHLTVLICSRNDTDKHQQQDPVNGISWVLWCTAIPLVLRISIPFLFLLVSSDNVSSSEEEILLP